MRVYVLDITVAMSWAVGFAALHVAYPRLRLPLAVDRKGLDAL